MDLSTVQFSVSKRAVDKKCGTCDNWKDEVAPEQLKSEKCMECESDKCNKQLDIKR